MMEKYSKSKKTINCLLIFTLAFIWGNSMLGREASSDESSMVMEWIQPVLEIIVGKGNVTEYLVRKLAHFSEFALLGAEACFRFSLTGKTGRHAVALAAAHGLFAAFMDETIQIFSHRGPMVQDMWIDFSGVICGALFASAVAALIRKKRTSSGSRGGNI